MQRRTLGLRHGENRRCGREVRTGDPPKVAVRVELLEESDDPGRVSPEGTYQLKFLIYISRFRCIRESFHSIWESGSLLLKKYMLPFASKQCGLGVAMGVGYGRYQKKVAWLQCLHLSDSWF